MSTCQHCGGAVEYGTTEQGHRGFVHTASGLAECPPPAEVEHRIRWFVRVDVDTWIPRTSTMRGLWFYDAKCSCGWESRTGGASERSVRRSIADHRADVAWAAKADA